MPSFRIVVLTPEVQIAVSTVSHDFSFTLKLPLSVQASSPASDQKR
jgi:hypothetical protein